MARPEVWLCRHGETEWSRDGRHTSHTDLPLTPAGEDEARRDPALAEWDYGDYEGRTTPEIREEVPGWTVWSHPSPGGETAEEVAQRADRVIERVLAQAAERALVFSHSHFLRVLAARWLDESPAFGERLVLDTATVSVLGWQRDARAVRRWNLPP